MKAYCSARAAGAAFVWCVFLLVLLYPAPTFAERSVAANVGMEVLTRGPVHEAFAEASMAAVDAGFVVHRKPYEAIAEVPPDQRPEGADVAWIPGYWSWDEDRSDFIWVSGVWRDLPPGREWIPGYWASAQGGYQWISGFWCEIAQTEIAYLPPPPQSLEVGPSSPPPAPGNVWSQGSWVWQQSRYDWQPGYWVAQQPDWVWTPAHYTWTPRGYVYIPGFWDYSFSRRGVLFAPVYYQQPVYRQTNYFYAPSIIIDLRAITACLFIQPRSHHYYFGDYYDTRYDSRGIYPWHQTRDHGYDPLYVQYRQAQLNGDRDWDAHVDEQYRNRRDHADARPPQTLALQININTNQGTRRDHHFLGQSLADTVQNNTQSLRFRSVDPSERAQLETRGRQVRTFQAERAAIEAPENGTVKPDSSRDSGRAVRVAMPVSLGSMRSTGRPEVANSPPPRPDVPSPRVTDERGKDPTARSTDGRPSAPGNEHSPRKTEPSVGNPPTARTTPPKARLATPQRIETSRDPDHRTSAPVGRSTTRSESRDKPATVRKAAPREESSRSSATMRHGRSTPPGKSESRGTSN